MLGRISHKDHRVYHDLFKASEYGRSPNMYHRNTLRGSAGQERLVVKLNRYRLIIEFFRLRSKEVGVTKKYLSLSEQGKFSYY